ncbi:MAG: DMT family transporter [Deltaproteobacteria bacterium]|nr:DMT family transporter [Deltaproteobacteria bacterium]
MTPHVIGVIFALTSAVVWGTGDFSGGVATRIQNQFQVLFLMTVPGIVVLVIIAAVIGEPFPSPEDSLWALCAGTSGAFGVAALYKGLAGGNAATVAPTAAVIGAGIPVIFSFFFLGIPGISHILGFITAVFGIWFVSRPVRGHEQKNSQGLIMAILAGIGFGGFFTLIAQVEQGLVFSPLVLAKTAALILALVLIFFRHDSLPSLRSNPIAIIAGFFDAGGNVFFLLAKQFTRLDVAAVLASMYPSVTVVLACMILKEKVSVSQWGGVFLCVIAIALIGM